MASRKSAAAIAYTSESALGRGDAAEVAGIVDDGLKKSVVATIALLVVQAVHRRVVARFDPTSRSFGSRGSGSWRGSRRGPPARSAAAAAPWETASADEIGGRVHGIKIRDGAETPGRRHGSTVDAFDEVIDVRSPAEFALDHVPAAVNCPVLDDAERPMWNAVQAILPFRRKKNRAALVAKNIARHIDEHFRGRGTLASPRLLLARGNAPRDGLRAAPGRWDAATLEGGYRASVAKSLRSSIGCRKVPVQVVCGATGSGKSRLLAALAEQDAQVLDLERLAATAARCSASSASRSLAKMFDSLVWCALKRLGSAASGLSSSGKQEIGQLAGACAAPSRMREGEWPAHRRCPCPSACAS